jgi:hypothetical protein
MSRLLRLASVIGTWLVVILFAWLIFIAASRQDETAASTKRLETLAEQNRKLGEDTNRVVTYAGRVSIQIDCILDLFVGPRADPPPTDEEQEATLNACVADGLRKAGLEPDPAPPTVVAD